MRNIKRIRIFLLALLCFMTCACFTSYALSSRIAFSDPSGEAGSEITVTMKVSSLDDSTMGKIDVMLSYDASFLEFVSGTNAEGGAGSLHIQADASDSQKLWSTELKFKTLKAGSTAITVKSWEIYDTNGTMATLDKQGASAITITAAADSSNNANLKSLKISPGTLTPEFDENVKEYTAGVGMDVSKIAVTALPSDDNAILVISGGDNLTEGENVIDCKITAQDGTTVQDYKITVTKSNSMETPTESAGEMQTSNLKATIGGKDYNIAANFDETKLPEGYTAQDYTYNGKTIRVGVNSDQSLMLMYLIDDSGSGDFYYYYTTTDAASGETKADWQQYSSISVGVRTVTLLPADSSVALPAGLIPKTLLLGDNQNIYYSGWIGEFDNGSNYCVVYGMNQDGAKGFYRYDLSERTIQRYFTDTQDTLNGANSQNPQTKDQYASLQKKYSTRGVIMYLFIILTILLSAFLIWMFIKSGNPFGGGGIGKTKKDAVDLFADRKNSREKTSLHFRSRKRKENDKTEDINLSDRKQKSIEELDKGHDDFKDIDF